MRSFFNKSAGARCACKCTSVRFTQLMWACSTNAWNGEVCFAVAVVCRLVVVEDRVIPAERRGSCCFLLGIVSVTFLGASHAEITDDSSLSVVKIHPARRCDGVLSSLWDPETSSLQTACSSSDLTGSASTAGTKFKKRLGRFPTPRCPSKIIFLHFPLTGTARKKKKEEAPSLQLTPTAKKKSP